MILYNHISRTLIALVLTVAIALPTAVQLVHTLEGHAHQDCQISQTHIHEHEIDCSIDQFHLSVFNFEPIEHVPGTWSLVALAHTDAYTTHDSNYFWNGIYLRGPPHFS